MLRFKTYHHVLFLSQSIFGFSCPGFDHLHVLVLGIVIYDRLEARMVVHVMHQLDGLSRIELICHLHILGFNPKEILHVRRRQ